MTVTEQHFRHLLGSPKSNPESHTVDQHGNNQKYENNSVNLPQSVKLLAIWDRELASPVPVNAIVHDLSFM